MSQSAHSSHRDVGQPVPAFAEPWSVFGWKMPTVQRRLLSGLSRQARELHQYHGCHRAGFARAVGMMQPAVARLEAGTVPTLLV